MRRRNFIASIVGGLAVFAGNQLQSGRRTDRLTKDGRVVPVEWEDIRPGDWILATDVRRGRIVSQYGWHVMRLMRGPEFPDGLALSCEGDLIQFWSEVRKRSDACPSPA